MWVCVRERRITFTNIAKHWRTRTRIQVESSKNKKNNENKCNLMKKFKNALLCFKNQKKKKENFIDLCFVVVVLDRFMNRIFSIKIWESNEHVTYVWNLVFVWVMLSSFHRCFGRHKLCYVENIVKYIFNGLCYIALCMSYKH